MWNIGFGELAVICIVLIIAVGPERLPSMMKTVGKTVRTLRQASRDLRESTGIDELLREDFDYHPPPVRKPAPPVGPSVAREVEPVMNPTTTPMAGVSAQDQASPSATDAGASLPSDGPLTAAVAPASGIEPSESSAAPIAEPVAPPEHANVAGTLPSDAPLEGSLSSDAPFVAKAPSIPAPPPAGPLTVPPVAPPDAAPLNEAKPRES
jgi:sec-independent protein translocase protein TatB